MNANDFERLRRENEELRSQLRAKLRENSDLNTQITRLTEAIEDLKQDKQVLRENAKYCRENLARDIAGCGKAIDVGQCHVIRSNVTTIYREDSFQHQHRTNQQIKVQPAVTPHSVQRSISRATATVQVKIEDKERSPSLEIIEPTIKPRPKNEPGVQGSHAGIPVDKPSPSPSTSADAVSEGPPNLSTKAPYSNSRLKPPPSSQTATALGKRKAETTPSSSSSRVKRVNKESSAFPQPIDSGSGPGGSHSADSDAKPDLKRPVIKYKEEEAFVLPPDLIARYLRDAPTLDIKPNPSGLHVRRDYLRLLLGGSDMQFIQKVEAKNNPTQAKARTLTFPTFDMNPAMPLIPGEPGLILSKRPEVLECSPLTLFRRDLGGKEAVWQYLGEYETKVVGMMTGELFRQQNDKVQSAWVKTILERTAQKAYRTMKTRISLRKRGLPIPSEAECKKSSEAATTQGKEKGKKKKNNEDEGGWPDLNEADVVGALLRGEEGVEVVRLQCVSYDRTFVKHIQDNFERYPAMLEEEKERKETSKGQRKAPKATPTASSSRRSPPPQRLRKKTSKIQDQGDGSESDFRPSSPDPDQHASSPMANDIVATSALPRRKQTARRGRPWQYISSRSPSEVVKVDYGDEDSSSDLSYV
ncbi:hypothetical protein MD484_g8821, partial [Candolleomyces efflorescens]